MTFGDLTNMRNAPARKSNSKKHKNVKRVEYVQPEITDEKFFNLLTPDQWVTFCSLPERKRRSYVESVRIEIKPEKS
jgi:hypothetical protein